MPRVSLPPGCYGLKDQYGRATRKVKPGSSVTVSDEMARAIKKSSNGQLGIISAGQAVSLGTKTGRRCIECGFLGQCWNDQCPKCEGATVIE